MRRHRSWVLVSVAVWFASVGCSQKPEEPSPTDEAPPPAGPERPAEPPRADVRLFKRSRPIMGTVFEITVADAREDVAGPAVERALDEIARLEEVLSEWRDTSEISRINQSAGRSPVRVSDDAYRVVKAGVDVSRWSDGAFDLSWATLRDLYDFRPGRGRAPSRGALRRRLPLVDWTDIVLDDEEKTVFLRRTGMAIGTGGIAKGYALDRAAAVLEDAGLDSFMLFGGGQVQVRGQRGHRPWRVGIQHPRRSDYFAFLQATEGSISTSGDYEHVFVDDGGRRWHHILDLRTGLPASRSLSVTVVAPAGLYSDALSTACFVLGPSDCRTMLAERVPQTIEAVIVDPDFRLHTTDGTKDRLTFRMPLEHGRLPN